MINITRIVFQIEELWLKCISTNQVLNISIGFILSDQNLHMENKQLFTTFITIYFQHSSLLCRQQFSFYLPILLDRIILITIVSIYCILFYTLAIISISMILLSLSPSFSLSTHQIYGLIIFIETRKMAIVNLLLFYYNIMLLITKRRPKIFVLIKVITCNNLNTYLLELFYSSLYLIDSDLLFN